MDAAIGATMVVLTVSTSSDQVAAQDVAKIPEGLYVLCRSLFESERLELRGGRFHHQHISDVGGFGENRGVYRIEGNRLLLRLEGTQRLSRLYELIAFEAETVNEIPVLRKVHEADDPPYTLHRGRATTLVHESALGDGAGAPDCRELGVVDG